MSHVSEYNTTMFHALTRFVGLCRQERRKKLIRTRSSVCTFRGICTPCCRWMFELRTSWLWLFNNKIQAIPDPICKQSLYIPHLYITKIAVSIFDFLILDGLRSNRDYRTMVSVLLFTNHWWFLAFCWCHELQLSYNATLKQCVCAHVCAWVCVCVCGGGLPNNKAWTWHVETGERTHNFQIAECSDKRVLHVTCIQILVQYYGNKNTVNN